ncbi:unnamed protein product [Euphydryas editha]|uniref:PiggyBac transposable element-derived protein domain-containing protein n=1 Tax=Euphydryas editha TaxID=104508 RepID=A0AAU9TUR9_EUPED|nr:unnamed protein product [Euphydryas editha]
MERRKIIPLDKIEDCLEELFGLSDGEESEDGFESGEEETEAVFTEPSQEELLDVLNAPSTSSAADLGSTVPSDEYVVNADGVQIESISDTDDDDDDQNWKKVYFPHLPPTDRFDDSPLKLKGVLPPRSSPIIYFELFFSDEVLTHIVEQTNLYALQNKQKNWENTFVTEIRAFLGMLVLMGVHPLPNIDLYWSSDPFFCVSEIADVMTSKRFKMILKNLHLNDNSQMPKKGEPQFDKLYKIRPLIKTMNETFQSAAKNTCSQSIDECMVKFKGRSSLKQFLPNKPVKRGFKIWARCDSQTGYLFEFEIYTGKKGNEAETGLGESVVKDLCQKLIDEKLENVHVTFDNFFSSTELLQKLYENNIYSTSTVRTNRTNLPKKFRRLAKKNQTKQPVLKLAKGQYKWRVNRNVSFFTWMDTKLVTILSTAYHPKSKVTCKRTQKDGSKKEFPCPLGILEYTKRMGGVDRFDQKRGTYQIARKSKRWWMRLFYFFVDAAITNAYILYAQKIRYPINNLQFRTTLGRNLIGNFTSRKRRISSLPCFATKKPKIESRQKAKYGIPDEMRLTDVGSHLPSPLPTFRRCRACSSKEIAKKSKIQCSTCGVALCIVPCFAEFHKL